MRLKSVERLEPRAVLPDACSGAPSRAARRRRPTAAGRAGARETTGVSRSAAISSGVTWLTSIDERRSRSRPSIAPASRIERRRASSPAPRSRKQPRLTPGEHDLAVTLRDAPPDLVEHRVGDAAARRAADERDHAERARERAAVLDLDEGADAVEPVVRLDAADRTDVAGDGLGDLLAAPGDDDDVVGQAGERVRRRGWRRTR